LKQILRRTLIFALTLGNPRLSTPFVTARCNSAPRGRNANIRFRRGDVPLDLEIIELAAAKMLTKCSRVSEYRGYTAK